MDLDPNLGPHQLQLIQLRGVRLNTLTNQGMKENHLGITHHQEVAARQDHQADQEYHQQEVELPLPAIAVVIPVI